MASRKCWIGFTAKPKGILRIDDGAVKAILEKGKRLLPIGIAGVEGEFGVGAAVEFRNGSDEALGIGIVNYSAEDIRKIMRLKTNEIQDVLGEKPYDEVIHRNNLVLTGECMME